MADVATPAAAASGGIAGAAFVTAFDLASLGLHPKYMICGLVGVVIVQTFLPRNDNSLFRVAAIATGSMFVASLGGPVIAAALLAAIPDGWGFIKNLPVDHLKAVSATIAGGFAQPLLLWVQSKIPKPAAAVKE